VLGDRRLYLAEFAAEPQLVAREAATGRQIWSRPLTGGMPGTAPLVGDLQVFVATEETLHAFRTETGRREWTVDLPAGPATAPKFTGSEVVLAHGTPDGTTLLGMYDDQDGEELWSRELPGLPGGTVAFSDDNVVLSAGRQLFGVERNDGDLEWEATLPARAGTVVAGDEQLYVADVEGTVHARRRATGQERWTESVAPSTSGAAPALNNRQLYVGASNGLHSLDADNGRPRWHVEFEGPTPPPTVASGRVYVGSAADGTVRALLTLQGDSAWTVETGEGPLGDGETGRAVLAPPLPLSDGVFVVAADGVHALGRA
jgi:outer membrane protein assembly factor BamB